MKHLLFTRNDGKTDYAIIAVHKENGYYAGYITIGIIRKQVISGMIDKNDAHVATVRILSNYRDNSVI